MVEGRLGPLAWSWSVPCGALGAAHSAPSPRHDGALSGGPCAGIPCGNRYNTIDDTPIIVIAGLYWTALNLERAYLSRIDGSRAVGFLWDILWIALLCQGQ